MKKKFTEAKIAFPLRQPGPLPVSQKMRKPA